MGKIIAVLVAVLLVSIAWLGRAHAASTTTVNVTLKEFSVDMSQGVVPAGTPVTFQVTNEGKIQHEFVVEKAGAVDQALEDENGGEKMDAEIEPFNPGQTKTLQWTFLEPGTYQVACHVPGHFEAGMKATFTVAGSPQQAPATGGIADNPSYWPVAVALGLVLLVLASLIGFIMRNWAG